MCCNAFGISIITFFYILLWSVYSRMTVTTVYFGHAEQVSQESYLYVDCGSNTTSLNGRQWYSDMLWNSAAARTTSTLKDIRECLLVAVHEHVWTRVKLQPECSQTHLSMTFVDRCTLEKVVLTWQVICWSFMVSPLPIPMFFQDEFEM